MGAYVLGKVLSWMELVRLGLVTWHLASSVRVRLW